MANGTPTQPTMGRPKGSSGGVLSSPKGLQAYAWLKTWIEVTGDEDPVGLKYKFVVNYVLPSDLYEEYCSQFSAYQIGEAEVLLAGRSFVRVFTHFKKQ